MSTVTVAKGSQNVFVAAPNTAGTAVPITSVVTLTPASGQSSVAGTYTLTMVLKNAANPNGFTGSNTYSVTASSGVQAINVTVTTTVPAGKYGTFAATATTTVSFTDGSVVGTGDTCATLVAKESASSKLGITKDSVKTVRRNELVNMDIEIKNNGQSDAELTIEVVPVVLEGGSMPEKLADVVETWGFTNHREKIVMQAQGTIEPGNATAFPFSVLADGEIGSSAEYIFRITGTLDGEEIDACVGTGYSIKE